MLQPGADDVVTGVAGVRSGGALGHDRHRRLDELRLALVEDDERAVRRIAATPTTERFELVVEP